MDTHEYKAQALLPRHGLPVARGKVGIQVADSPAGLGSTLKSVLAA
jgi:succinyl-CoA synthetase beta subunit